MSKIAEERFVEMANDVIGETNDRAWILILDITVYGF